MLIDRDTSGSTINTVWEASVIERVLGWGTKLLHCGDRILLVHILDDVTNMLIESHKW